MCMHMHEHTDTHTDTQTHNTHTHNYNKLKYKKQNTKLFIIPNYTSIITRQKVVVYSRKYGSPIMKQLMINQ